MIGLCRIPNPALLACGGAPSPDPRGTRTSVCLVVESGEAREVHHFALLAGYGAEAINPYLAFETLTTMAKDLPRADQRHEAVKALHQGDDKGVLKVMSKMGISTFRAIAAPRSSRRSVSAAHRPLFHRHADRGSRHRTGRDRRRTLRAPSPKHFRDRRTAELGVGGIISGATTAKSTLCNPQTIIVAAATPYAATIATVIAPFARLIDEQSRASTARCAACLRIQDGGRPTPVPLDEVEPAEEIVKRFKTGAMSLRLDQQGSP